jgi:hypothetical protein
MAAQRQEARAGEDELIQEFESTTVCDFCSSESPVWLYAAESFFDTVGSKSVSDWLACEDCHRLIEAGARDALAARVILTPTFKAGLAAGIINETFAKHYARGLHDGFFEHRRGPARRISV